MGRYFLRLQLSMVYFPSFTYLFLILYFVPSFNILFLIFCSFVELLFLHLRYPFLLLHVSFLCNHNSICSSINSSGYSAQLTLPLLLHAFPTSKLLQFPQAVLPFATSEGNLLSPGHLPLPLRVGESIPWHLVCINQACRVCIQERTLTSRAFRTSASVFIHTRG